MRLKILKQKTYRTKSVITGKKYDALVKLRCIFDLRSPVHRLPIVDPALLHNLQSAILQLQNGSRTVSQINLPEPLHGDTGNGIQQTPVKGPMSHDQHVLTGSFQGQVSS